MNIQDLEKTVGNTPIKRLGDSNIYVKLENENPAGSIKDRTALYIVKGAIERGIIRDGGTVIEATSGNTGIGLAYICRELGYKAIIVMPDNMSKERISLIESYGAKVVLTDGNLGMQGAVERAEDIHSKTENSIIAGQFENEDNKIAHFQTTAREIDKYFKGNIDVIVSGIGTGGTVSGLGEYFKKQSKNKIIIGVEPSASPLLTKGYSGRHQIQGIGANFVPKLLNRSVIDVILDISDEQALDGVKRLYRDYGLKLGISSGASFVASEMAEKVYPKKKIVFIAPDGEDRYKSMELYK